MNSPTDTNQASEELRKSVEQCFIKNNMCDCGGEHNDLSIDETEYFDVESVVNDVISLIRTEKLKTKMDLLKTIRRSYPKKQTLQGNAQSRLTLADIDRLIGDTKLEAEL